MSWLSNRRAAAAAARKRTTQEHIARHEEGIADFLADKEANAPKDWGAAYKAAGGGQKAAILAGANTAVGAVTGGGIDAAIGDDSWVDGAAVGAGLGAVGGIGAFAKSVHGLKVGKMTYAADGGAVVNYSGPNSVNFNTGKYDKAKAMRSASSTIPE